MMNRLIPVTPGFSSSPQAGTVRREAIGAHTMVFEDSSQTSTGSRYLGEGFRHEPDFREGTPTTLETETQPAAAPTDTEATLTLAKRGPTPNLDYVFDDPAEGEPGRDRMLVHGLWELVLVIAVAGVGYLLYREDSAAFAGEHLRALLLAGSTLGLLAAACALSLRAGVPNLAVGAVATAAGLYFGHHAGGGLLQTVPLVVGLCAAVGAVQGLVIVGLHVPGWAASIGAGLVLLIWSGRQAAVTLTDGYDPAPHAYYWFVGFCVVSVLFGLIGLVPPVRRAFGRFRPVADPAHRRGVVAGLIALGATVVSTILAGVGGVLAVSVTREATPSDGLELSALGLGAALLGGTSAYGRRGGIFGTVFAVGLLTVVGEYATATGRAWGTATLAAAAIGLGLVVTRLIERFGRPEPGRLEEGDEDWTPKVHSTGNGRTWQPAAPSSAAGGIWASDEAWGSSERR